MSVPSDPIADLLTRLRNAVQARKSEFTVPYSKMKSAILHILKNEGYINDVIVETIKNRTLLKVSLKYVDKKCPLSAMKRVSSPGLRKYVESKKIPLVLRGMGIVLLSTSQGVLTGQEARRRNLGGEVLAYIS